MTGSSGTSPRVMVLAPSPLLTVTVEEGEHQDEIHLHAGGQGFWIARMVGVFEVDAVLCATFGGETGAVARALIGSAGLAVNPVAASGSNGSYVHDRRSGERRAVATVPPARLTRHEVDDLYNAALVEGLDASVAVLGGPPHPMVMMPDFYRRLTKDLRTAGRLVVADLSGAFLDAVLAGGLTVLKVSDEELLDAGRIADRSRDAVVAAVEELRAGADHVVVTRAAKPAIASIAGTLVELTGPDLEPLDERGAGDSLTGAVAACLAGGHDVIDAVRIGVAAGALNVTRRGLASGSRQAIERLAERVEVRRLEPVGAEGV